MKSALAAYDNFVFDFYGTLVDIHTNEYDDRLWEELAGFYGCYGAIYSGREIHEAYNRLIKQQEEALAKASQRTYPEVEQGRVFRALLEEAPKKRTAILAAPVSDGRSGRQTAAFFGTANVRGRKMEETAAGRRAMTLTREVAAAEALRGFRRDPWSEAARLSSEGAAGTESWSEERWEIWTTAVANFFRTASRQRFAPYPHTEATLRELKEAGKRVYLLSNAQSIFTVPEIEEAGLYWYFDDIFISSEQQVKKPDPSFLAALMHRHSMLPSRTVMIGNDFFSDMGVAALCGVDGIFLNTDRYDNTEMQRRLSAMHEATGTHTQPRIIWDGDIGKILQKEA